MGPKGNRSDRYSPHGAYRTADEYGAEHWVSIAVGNDAEWQALLGVLGITDVPEELATHLGRLRNAAQVDELIEPAIRARDRAQLAAELQAVGVSAYPLQSCLDLRTDENLLEFGFWPWLDQTECGPMPYDGLAYRLDRTPGEQTAAPNVGEHTEEVLGRLLGMGVAEIKELADANVIY
jgi:benzylsuccinate CoA-transferase BbsF subunit